MSSTPLAETEEDVFDLTDAVPETERLDSSLQKAKAQLSIKTRRHRPSRSRLRDSLSSTEGDDSLDGKSYSGLLSGSCSPLHVSLHCPSPLSDLHTSYSPAMKDRAFTYEVGESEKKKQRRRSACLLDPSSPTNLFKGDYFLQHQKEHSPMHHRDHLLQGQEDNLQMDQGDHLKLHIKDNSHLQHRDHPQLHPEGGTDLHQGDQLLLHLEDHTHLLQRDHTHLQDADHIRLQQEEHIDLHKREHNQKDLIHLQKGGHLQKNQTHLQRGDCLQKAHTHLQKGDHLQKDQTHLHKRDHIQKEQTHEHEKDQVQLHERNHSPLHQREYSQSEDDAHDVGSDEPSSPTVLLDKKTRRRFLDLGVTLRRTYGKVRKERASRHAAENQEPDRAENRSLRSSAPPFMPFSWLTERIRGSGSPKNSSQSPAKSLSEDEELKNDSRSTRNESSQPYQSLSDHSDEGCDEHDEPLNVKKKTILPFSSGGRDRTEKQNGVQREKREDGNDGDSQKLLTSQTQCKHFDL
ncbi:hypothetical protein Q7C36_002186 [Tachysurus vachellii]|uniref:Uncharacterized protein n=1 Tax=Tachysurus vachellii TaxID=175792 RepID=A0AA88NX33_TACVA|nr:hypothetical protein Q7C36_002186 [Tachysurus vachellii]